MVSVFTIVPRRRLALALTIVLSGWLVVVAGISVARVHGNSWVDVVADVAVGAAYIVVAGAMPVGVAERALVASVGVTWLIASALPALSLVHVTMLVLALLLTQDGTVDRWGWGRWVVSAGALLVPWGIIPRPYAAIVFAAAALVCATDGIGRRGYRRWFPVIAAASLALTVSGLWVWSAFGGSAFEPVVARHVYEAVLVTTAVGFFVAARGDLRVRANAVDEVILNGFGPGLEGLQSVLADAFDDPDLQLVVPTAELPEGSPPYAFPVYRSGVLVATVCHRTAALLDPRTVASVSRGVVLALQAAELNDELSDRLVSLGQARGRLLTAADDQRQAIADHLDAEVIAPIDRALRSISRLAGRAAGRVEGDALAIVAQELAGARVDVKSVVGAAPAEALGSGRLVPVLEEMAFRDPSRISVHASGGGDVAAETALFYVAAEAVANALKHADPSRITVSLRSEAGGLTLVVADDGRGGADPGGPGIRGLADRLEARGGQLKITSPSGVGTVVTARVPVSRP